MKLISLAFASLLLFSINTTTVIASDNHTQAAFKLLEVTNSQSLTDGMVTEMKQLLSDMPVGEDLTEQQQKLFDNFRVKMYVLIDSMLSWETLKPEYARIYTDNYTESELKQLISFYDSPIGQKVISSTASINTALANVPQNNLNILMSEMQTAAQAVMQEINQLKQPPSKEITTDSN